MKCPKCGHKIKDTKDYKTIQDTEKCMRCDNKEITWEFDGRRIKAMCGRGHYIKWVSMTPEHMALMGIKSE